MVTVQIVQLDRFQLMTDALATQLQLSFCKLMVSHNLQDMHAQSKNTSRRMENVNGVILEQAQLKTKAAAIP